MEKIRKRMVFSGMVQGVGFRYRSLHIASALGLDGWVRNTWDGKVEMEVQGDRESISRMVSLLHEQRFVCIEHMESEEIPVAAESGFHIR